ncbi:hypothetical protein EP837_02904 [Sphingobium sp. EP60837]|nr:hypothetical protein EP837_02904 [Sphingobium sp. EP60837]
MHIKGLAVVASGLLLVACNGGGSGVSSAGSMAGGLAGKVPSLVNVDLRNVLNDLAVRLNLDKANVPINAQIPISLAVNVCGVSINVLSASTGGQANCTANTASPELAQVVQQQMAAGGSVGGGAQGGSQATNGAQTGLTAPSGATPTSEATAPAGVTSQPSNTQP